MKNFTDKGLDRAAWVESISWKRPGVIEVKLCRWTLDTKDWVIPADIISQCVDYSLIGDFTALEFEFISGAYKVTIVFTKTERLVSNDSNKYSMRALIDREEIYNHPSIDVIVEKYMGWKDVNKRQIYFPKTILKTKLTGKNPNGKAWSGSSWPELKSPQGHIRNPYHGVQFYFRPSVEFTAEYLSSRAGFSSANKLGKADTPDFDGFNFLKSSSSSKRLTKSGEKESLKAQYKWICSDFSFRKNGGSIVCRQSWRSRVDPGWTRPVYK